MSGGHMDVPAVQSVLHWRVGQRRCHRRRVTERPQNDRQLRTSVAETPSTTTTAGRSDTTGATKSGEPSSSSSVTAPPP